MKPWYAGCRHQPWIFGAGMACGVAEWASCLPVGFGGDVRTGNWVVVVIMGKYDFGISSILAPGHASFAGGRVVDDAGDFGGDESCGAEWGGA